MKFGSGKMGDWLDSWLYVRFICIWPRFPLQCVAGADFPTGNCQKEGGGGVCGQHTLEDLLTLDHEQSSNTWLKRKREHESEAENIAEHCVKCGIRF